MTLLSVLITNAKGGCGKSTISTNLAAAFANAGLKSVLADADRQKSALAWLSLRPQEAPSIKGLDWEKPAGGLPKKAARLVIDAPAGLRIKDVDKLVEEADVVVVPVLPSIFDEQSTLNYLDRLNKIKPLRKGRKAVLVAANRLRPRERATQRLLDLLKSSGHGPTAQLHDRAIFSEAAARGLGVFDSGLRRPEQARADLTALLSAIEQAAD